jgi:maltooligosyltrehalose synthase
VSGPQPARIPLATYRLQLGPALTFDGAAALVDYLHALGISDAYTSPFFETSADRSHGYDVADHNRIRDELGGEAGFRRLVAALQQRGMGLLIDLVPNHMGIARNRNAWWLDVLGEGPASPHAAYFDIDWTPVKRELANKVLLPILGDHYGAVLERGELQLALQDGFFLVHYYDIRLPVNPSSYGRILSHRIEELQAALGADHPDVLEVKALAAWFATLAPNTERDPEVMAARRRDKQRGVERLVALLARSPAVRAFLGESLRRFNGKPGDARSFDLLDGLLADQAYRLAYWRVAGEEINYRRFFDINELAAIRVEAPEVFAETHRLIFALVAEGAVTGLRVDHPDGLYAPAEYFRRLQQGCGGNFYVVAEKILAPGEPLPRTWVTNGTTGYEFLNLLNGVFVDRSQARTMEHLYARLIRERPPFAEVVHESKRLVMQTSMGAFNGLAQTLIKITAPGVPDFYQGAELWDLSLVDPDNRRPVDWVQRRRLLDELTAATRAAIDRTVFAEELVKSKEDGRLKLFVIREALACRRAHAALFQQGEYRALEAEGPLAEHVCAFARLAGGHAALTVVPRLLARRGLDGAPLGPAYWEEATSVVLPPEAGTTFTNPMTGARLTAAGGRLALAEVFASLPAALLVAEGA